MSIFTRISILSFTVASFLFPSVSFAQLSDDPTGSSGCVELTKTMSYGARDATTNGEVSELQAFLKEKGYLKGVTTGSFGSMTRTAVKSLQAEILPEVDIADISETMVPSLDNRTILANSGFKLSNTGTVGMYTRAKIAYISCQEKEGGEEEEEEEGIYSPLPNITSMSVNKSMYTITVNGTDLSDVLSLVYTTDYRAGGQTGSKLMSTTVKTPTRIVFKYGNNTAGLLNTTVNTWNVHLLTADEKKSADFTWERVLTNTNKTLTVTKVGSGTVATSEGVSESQAIWCGTTCSSTLPLNTTITLTATPSTGATFTGWSGACTGTTPTCTVTMSEAKSVNATFTATTGGQTRYVWSCVVAGHDPINYSGHTCNAAKNTQLNGSSENVNGLDCYCDRTTSPAPTCSQGQILDAGDQCVPSTANTGTFPITVTKVGQGIVTSVPAGISCGSTCSLGLVSGTNVTLTAVPASGYTFSGWSGACNGSATCSVAMTVARNVTATFTATNVQATGQWTFSASCPTACGRPATTQTAVCTGGNGVCPGVATTRSCPATSVCATPVCTGSHPAEGNGVKLTPYDPNAGVQTLNPENTVYTYGASSCGWHCIHPTIRNGNAGCKNPIAGSGVKVKVNNLSTGRPFSGISMRAGMASINGSNENIPVYTTNSNGETQEFWLDTPAGSFPLIDVVAPGYKIRSAVRCTPKVFVHGSNQQYNHCYDFSNGSYVVIDMVPGDISTRPVLTWSKTSYTKGEPISGVIEGGDQKDMYGCMESPNTQSGYECTSGRTDIWRKLGGTGDDWKLVSTPQGDKIVLSSWPSNDLPVGRYTGYVKTGLHSSNPSGSPFTLVAGSVVPSTPTLSISRTSGLTTNNFTLNWTTSTNNPTDYRMIITGAFNSGDVLSQQTRTSFTGNFAQFGLGAGTYNVVIKACNATGCSPHSNTVTYVASVPAQAPTQTPTPTPTPTPTSSVPTCADPQAYYYYYNADVAVHSDYKSGLRNARYHWDTYGKSEGRKSCWTNESTATTPATSQTTAPSTQNVPGVPVGSFCAPWGTTVTWDYLGAHTDTGRPCGASAVPASTNYGTGGNSSPSFGAVSNNNSYSGVTVGGPNPQGTVVGQDLTTVGGPNPQSTVVGVNLGSLLDTNESYQTGLNSNGGWSTNGGGNQSGSGTHGVGSGTNTGTGRMGGMTQGAYASNVQCLNLPRNLLRGSESSTVTSLQNFLIQKGYLEAPSTGFYGDNTIEAVKDYQISKGLPATGMVYDFTRKAIEEETCR